MAVARVAFERGLHRYFMLSTDTAPAQNVPNGSTLHIVDTAAEYVFLGGSWYSTADGLVLA